MRKPNLAAILLIAAATSVYAVKMAPVVNCYLAGTKGLEEISPNVFLDGGLSASERERLLKDIQAARLRVEGFLGLRRASPRFLAGARIRGTATYRTPLCDCILLGPEGRNPDVIAHEMVHTELTARIGHLRQALSIPTWFDEGLAMHVDYRPPFGEEMYVLKTDGGRTAPRLGDINTSRKFHKTSYVSYLTAHHEFERWYSGMGPRGLFTLFNDLRAGRSFREAY